MATCAATGMILDDEGWSVPGAEGSWCAWHADLLALGNSVAEQTPDHWLLDQIALASREPCPNPGAPPEPPEPIDMDEEDRQHERKLLDQFFPTARK